jgi:hypothetical protein
MARDPVPDNTSDGDHNHTRTWRGTEHNVVPKSAQTPTRPRPPENFSVRSPGRGEPHPDGNISR